VVQLTDARLQHFLDEVEQSVQPLVEASFATVRTLQQASRNSGSVQLAEWSAEGGGFVAIKQMPRHWVCSSPSEFQDMHEASAEKPWVDLALVRYLHSIGYPYVCQPLGIFIDGESMHVVSSLATEGDLCNWCDSFDPAPGEAREGKMVPLAAQMFQAVRWLHELGIAHRDISLENITLTKSVSGEPAVKLIDFGMSSIAKSARNQLRGKASYQAPEIHTTHKYCTFMADTFSLGVVLFTLAAQDYPWKSTRRNTCEQFEFVRMMGLKKFLEKKTLHEDGRPLSQVFSPGLAGLLEGALERSPARRLTLGETALHKKSPERTSVWGCEWLADVQHMACGCPANIAEATARV
jgi:serine/threonine protein kinase